MVASNSEFIKKIEVILVTDLRWRIMRIVDASRPLETSESLLQKALCDLQPTIKLQELRRALDFLEKAEMLSIKDRNAATWLVGLTAKGINVVGYVIAAPEGIARPELG